MLLYSPTQFWLWKLWWGKCGWRFVVVVVLWAHAYTAGTTTGVSREEGVSVWRQLRPIIPLTHDELDYSHRVATTVDYDVDPSSTSSDNIFWRTEDTERISWTPDGIPVRTVYPPRPIIPRQQQQHQSGQGGQVGPAPHVIAPPRPGPLEIIQLGQQIVQNIRKKKRNKGKGGYKKKNKDKKKNKNKKKKRPSSNYGEDHEDQDEDDGGHDEEGDHHQGHQQQYGQYGQPGQYGQWQGGFGGGQQNVEEGDGDNDNTTSEELDDDDVETVESSEELLGDAAPLLSKEIREYEKRREQYYSYGLSLREIGGLPIFPLSGVHGNY